MNDICVNELPEEYQQRKSMILMIPNDKSTHVDFPMDKSINVYINRIRE